MTDLLVEAFVEVVAVFVVQLADLGLVCVGVSVSVSVRRAAICRPYSRLCLVSW